MKVWQKYVKKISEKFNISEDYAEKVYKIINKYDWAVFRSYMADDRDHPEERERAKKEKDEGFAGLNTKLAVDIEKYMHADIEYNIHHMNDGE